MPSVLNQIGNTPLVELVHLPGPDLRAAGVRVFAKLEGNNPAGSVKDRPALAMITAAEARGEIRPGDTLIEATSGNTGIALAMVAAVKGYRMVLIMPETQSLERRQSMQAYGAELMLVSKEEGMEGARDLALAMQAEGRGRVLDQFSNDDNWRAHYRSTGPEIWRQTAGSGRPGQQTEGRRWQTVGDLAGPPTPPADASELPLQQHQRRKGAGYAARAAM